MCLGSGPSTTLRRRRRDTWVGARSEPYGAAKAGINSLTLSLARAYAPKVRVNCIQAGPFLTDISKAWDMESFERNAKTGIALQRGGQPEEVVGAALYLVSEAGSFTTGAILRVDGGSFSQPAFLTRPLVGVKKLLGFTRLV